VVKRGDVWLARFDPTEGREIRKTRPCLVVSPPEIHDLLDIAIVAPMTTGGRPARYRIDVQFAGKNGRILLEQVRVIDKQRFVRRLGAVPAATILSALGTLREMFSD
jgi:mRNA interferase MazF